MAKPIKKHIPWQPAGEPGKGARRDEFPSGEHGKQAVREEAKRMGAGPFSSVPTPRPFRHTVFASEAEYGQSVASVVARIRTGQVQARTPEA
jgi:hypothetical protein